MPKWNEWMITLIFEWMFVCNATVPTYMRNDVSKWANTKLCLYVPAKCLKRILQLFTKEITDLLDKDLENEWDLSLSYFWEDIPK